MTSISFPRDLGALCTGVRTLLVIAPKRALTKAGVSRLLGNTAVGKLLSDALIQLAADTSPGDLGAIAGTLTGGKPARLIAGVLPDELSRHNCPARAECIRNVTLAANLARAGGTGVLLVLDHPDHALAAANAVAREARLFSRKTGKRPAAPLKLLAMSRDGQAVKLDTRIKETLAASRLAARLVDEPPTEMHPAQLATEARRALKGVAHVRVTEIVGDKLLTSKLGGLHAVGRAAVVPPRLLVARYTPPRAKGDLVALVGKGITYDTGGLHLKARGAMESMKGDMGGAAAVLGAFTVLAKAGTRRKLALVLGLAENAIGSAAYKPDDILTMHSGKTVEINNTDAEGRLALADGASYATRVLGGRTVLDAATLTGAQLISTGLVHAAVVCNDADLERILVEAGRATGDLTHPLPFAPELYKREFRSPIADMRNSVKNRGNAQVSCAAQFIYWHIEDTGARWGHIDLAGPAWRGDRGTGYGVALLAEAVRQM